MRYLSLLVAILLTSVSYAESKCDALLKGLEIHTDIEREVNREISNAILYLGEQNIDLDKPLPFYIGLDFEWKPLSREEKKSLGLIVAMKENLGRRKAAEKSAQSGFYEWAKAHKLENAFQVIDESNDKGYIRVEMSITDMLNMYNLSRNTKHSRVEYIKFYFADTPLSIQLQAWLESEKEAGNTPSEAMTKEKIIEFREKLGLL